MADVPDHPTPPASSALPVVNPSMSGQFANHPRRWQDLDYVYAVISRRSKGLSIGINLNIDKACNFDCVYCCVDRSVAPVRKDVDLEQVDAELTQMLRSTVDASIWQEPKFANIQPAFRRVNDIAFSGDGEPTAYPGFEQACRIAIAAKQAAGLDDVKIVVITNATLFDRPRVQSAFELLDRHRGEIWAKLDAGTEPYYQKIDRTKIPLKKVLDNIAQCGRTREIVIQSLFMAIDGTPLPDKQFDAYLDRLAELLDRGCRIKLVQLYTTARRTAESFVTPLTNEHLDALTARLQNRFPGLPAEVYYGVG